MKSNNVFEEPNNSKANNKKIHSNNKNRTYKHHNINNNFNYFYDYSNHDLIAEDENNCSISLSNTNNVEEWNWNFNEIDYDFDFEMNGEEVFDLDSSSFLKVSKYLNFFFLISFFLFIIWHSFFEKYNQLN